jgi:hypothetical protein
MKQGPVAAKLLAAMSALLSLTLAAGAEEARELPDERIAVATEATINLGVADLEAYCLPREADLYVDDLLAGRTPYAGKLEPGRHYLEVQIPGYYPQGLWLGFVEKTKYTLRFAPLRVVGTLELGCSPPDAELSIDGRPAALGRTELPVGRHRVEARRFGFEDQELELDIGEKETKVVDLAFVPAPFSISGLAFARAAFNPSERGQAGRAVLRFEASNFGSARAEIKDSGGRVVAVLEFPRIDAREQSATWEGRGPDGQPLPDGPYVAQLAARPDPGLPLPAPESLPEGLSLGPDGSLLAKAGVLIDSSMVSRPLGSASALPGLLYVADPRAQAPRSVSSEVYCFAPGGDLGAAAYGVSAVVQAGELVVLGFSAAAETAATGGQGGGFDLGLSILVPLFGERGSAYAGAISMSGAYSNALAPALPGAGKALEASFPVDARLPGPGAAELKFALAPGLAIDFSGSSARALAQARGGLWIEGSSFRAGASALLPFALAGGGASGGGFAPSWPARLALEGRLAPGSSPLVVAAYATAELEPGADPSFGFGLGLGFHF